MTHTTAIPLMSPAVRTKLIIVSAGLVLLGIAFGGARLLQYAQRGRLVIPDEKAAAAELLAQKLSGPRYFQAGSAASDEAGKFSRPEMRDGEPFISVANAESQVEHIVAERRLDAERTAKVHKLILRLTEPSDSRIVGEPMINLLKLNLALDELR